MLCSVLELYIVEVLSRYRSDQLLTGIMSENKSLCGVVVTAG